nr:THO complex subunit 1 [Euglena gracilis]
MSRPNDLNLRRRLREEAQGLLRDKSISSTGAVLTIEMALEVAGDAKSTQADKLLPVTLLGDLLDYTPLDKCGEVIELMERSDQQIKKCLDNMPSKLALLAMCKKLTGRLCMSKDTVLHGRVMLLLANFFDMYERSGLNLQGDTNQVETHVEAETDSQDAPGDSANDAATPALAKYDFYSLFWGFQDYFTHPNLLPDKLDKFGHELQVILREFDNNLHLDNEEGSSWALYTSSSLGSKADGLLKEGPITSLPKYLTSRRLMSLQLRDGTFRRYVLVQVLVLLHSVRHYRQGKEATAAQLAKVENLQADVVQCLKKIPPNGELFVKCVLQALKRETVWIQWKLDRCPDVKSNKGIEGATLLLEEHLKGKASVPEPKWHRMGNPALSKLWAEHDVPADEMCRLIRRGPTPDQFIKEFKDQLAPENAVEQKYYLSKNRLYVWRALRHISRQSLMTFCKSLAGATDKNAAEMFEKLVRDLDDEARQSGRDERDDIQIVTAPGRGSKAGTIRLSSSPVPSRDEPAGKKLRVD